MKWPHVLPGESRSNDFVVILQRSLIPGETDNTFQSRCVRLARPLPHLGAPFQCTPPACLLPCSSTASMERVLIDPRADVQTRRHAKMVCCLCPDTPPDKVSAKGSRGGAHKTMLNMQEAPHQFAIGLKDSCCAEPCCCILSGAGAPCGFTACWARGAVLDKYYTRGRRTSCAARATCPAAAAST